MKNLLLCCVLAAAATGSVASANGPAAGAGFETAYRAALAREGKAFAAAGPQEAEKTLKALAALPDADQARIAALRRELTEMEALRRPVPAPIGPKTPLGLDAAYAAKVARYAKEFGADPAAALETRRRLAQAQLARSDGASSTAAAAAAAAGAPAPTAEAQRRMAAATDRARSMDASRAQAWARALNAQKAGPGALPDAAAVRNAPRPAARPAGALRNSDFAVGQHLKTGAVPSAAPAEPAPKETPSLWERTKSALVSPLSGAKEAYDRFAERRMKDSERLEQEGAKRLEQGGVLNTVAAGWDATKAWGNRLAAGDEKTVKQAAIGAAVVIGAVVAAPVVGAASVAAGVGAVVEGGVAGLTAYNVVKGTAALAKEPNAANAALLAVNFAPIPFLGKIAHAAGGVAEKGVLALKNAKPESELLAAGFAGVVAIGERVGQREVQVLAKSAVHDMTEVVGHKTVHASLDAAAEAIEPPHEGREIPVPR